MICCVCDMSNIFIFFCGVHTGGTDLEQRGGVHGYDTQSRRSWLPEPCELVGPSDASGSHQGHYLHRPWSGLYTHQLTTSSLKC